MQMELRLLWYVTVHLMEKVPVSVRKQFSLIPLSFIRNTLQFPDGKMMPAHHFLQDAWLLFVLHAVLSLLPPSVRLPFKTVAVII